MPTESMDLTFFAWGDTHFGYQQGFRESDLRWRIITQMNHLVGWPYPQELGGAVARPAFVVHCGDIVDGDQHTDLELAYYRYYLAELAFPHYEVLGNHDLAPAFLDQFIARYGARSYSFMVQGLHCVSLSGEYDEYEEGRIPIEDIRFLERDLQLLASETPILLFTHSRLDRLHNGDEVLEILRGRRVLLVMSAHLHRPAVFYLQGIPCVDIGHCRDHPIDPEYGRSFCVVHLSEQSITAIPWRWDLQDWERGQRWEEPATVSRFTLHRQLTS